MTSKLKKAHREILFELYASFRADSFPKNGVRWRDHDESGRTFHLKWGEDIHPRTRRVLIRDGWLEDVSGPYNECLRLSLKALELFLKMRLSDVHDQSKRWRRYAEVRRKHEEAAMRRP